MHEVNFGFAFCKNCRGGAGGIGEIAFQPVTQAGFSQQDVCRCQALKNEFISSRTEAELESSRLEACCFQGIIRWGLKSYIVAGPGAPGHERKPGEGGHQLFYQGEERQHGKMDGDDTGCLPKLQDEESAAVEKAMFIPYTLLGYFITANLESCKNVHQFFKQQIQNSKSLNQSGIKEQNLFFNRANRKIDYYLERLNNQVDLLF